MNISIVIPVYNEGDHLAACLRAIGAQQLAPFEVIVVNNNSTDNSLAIAQAFSFVTVIREAKQGVVHARGRGFDAAKGEIIARIDADTLVPPDWTRRIAMLFRDPNLDAVSGPVSYYDLPWKRLLGRIDLILRQWTADGMGNNVFLYGSNMALRRTAWRQVRSSVCLQAGLHEDFDIAIHLCATGAVVRFDGRLRAAVSLRRFNIAFSDYWHYVWLCHKTYQTHALRSQHRMYSVLALGLANYFVLRLLYRCYDPSTNTVSLLHLSNERSALRVNPATFVD